VIKMLTADPPIAFKRIIDKKTGKPRLAVTRENIVDEVRFTSLPSARAFPRRVRRPSLRVMRNCHLIASRLCLNGRIHAYNP